MPPVHRRALSVALCCHMDRFPFAPLPEARTTHTPCVTPPRFLLLAFFPWTRIKSLYTPQIMVLSIRRIFSTYGCVHTYKSSSPTSFSKARENYSSRRGAPRCFPFQLQSPPGCSTRNNGMACEKSHHLANDKIMYANLSSECYVYWCTCSELLEGYNENVWRRRTNPGETFYRTIYGCLL
jgi:hypothetical protein